MNRLPGSHTPNIKNRSSKQLYCLTKIKPVIKSMNGEQLKSLVDGGNSEALKEMKRRNKIKKTN